MATYNSYFVSDDQKRNQLGDGLPIISEGLDSVRAYQWEIHLELPPDITDTNQDKLTLAAKQITAVGFSTEAIEVNRVNDKVFYPGKASPEEVTVTFDNLYQPQIGGDLISGLEQNNVANGDPVSINGFAPAPPQHRRLQRKDTAYSL